MPDNEERAASDPDEPSRSGEGGAEESQSPASVPDLEGVPSRVRRRVESVSLQRMSYSGPVPNPLIAKLNDAHIDKMLDYGDAENQRDHRQTHSARWFNLIIFLSALAAIVGVLLFLVWQDERELAGQILAGLALFGSGLAGGYGLGRRR